MIKSRHHSNGPKVKVNRTSRYLCFCLNLDFNQMLTLWFCLGLCMVIGLLDEFICSGLLLICLFYGRWL
ncbi:MAG TPA: hypothetical protein DER18_14375 [Shewanella baltica]|nr:hypothetical protein [Shewanella baltica]